jgi:hypothetical protein
MAEMVSMITERRNRMTKLEELKAAALAAHAAAYAAWTAADVAYDADYDAAYAAYAACDAHAATAVYAAAWEAYKAELKKIRGETSNDI